ncbi:hypothetical protein [Jannaschia seohaensis]|uniref:Uncharacterized protein n=1 Tax=Jannaschia seohaensis TaxID=475081 RepID=A0A2Y9ACG3_9RHOB|nr:hypothetical protein [Jannaschia seohaensis]PWJ21256.1 hypothetical protein BCF38_102506 [Jannaschia seohaensis]SSA41666.1 hypothetical protein SAMN05421539_102506 [Jannaschia seohaensis]
MSPTRRIATFAAIFFLVNLAFDAYRAGGVTVGALGSALFITIAGTVIYVLVLRWQARRDKE